jgi:predicted dehydrogenase
MQKLKVGIIGLEFGLSCHLPAFIKNKKCDVIALCSKKKNKAKLAAKKNNIPYFFDKWKEMLDNLNFDLISIAVPPLKQEKIINYCLKKSIPIFAEKPLAVNIKTVKKIFNLQKKLKIPCGVDFEFPEIDEFIIAKKILDNKKLGSIKNVNIDLHYQSKTNRLKQNSWKNNFNIGGGILNNVVPHIFYYIEWFLEPINSISTFLFSEKNYKFSGYTNAIILMKFSSGTKGIINASNNAIGVNEHIINFSNDKGSVMLKGQDQDWITGFKVYLTDNQKLTQKKILLKKKKINKNSDTRIYPVSKIIDRLVDCIFSKKETYPNFKDGYRTQYLVENAIKSHKYKSKWIKLQN